MSAIVLGCGAAHRFRLTRTAGMGALSRNLVSGDRKPPLSLTPMGSASGRRIVRRSAERRYVSNAGFRVKSHVGVPGRMNRILCVVGVFQGTTAQQELRPAGAGLSTEIRLKAEATVSLE